ncbi:high choriolytic enzyme 1 isoform X2 [Pygocentrus nattereri]|uniref:high choriolytic enzyme 1 isoform X2 n=1 Tax=Pygocentrus nattereri TaxID=42514 RepID=UPI001891EC01|nr:high choriolytic enzyme 1 isoform X2 [Pygocentrus nattereri]
MSSSAFIIFIFTLLQGFALSTKNSEEFNAGTTRGSDNMMNSVKTAMDTIITVNDDQEVFAVDGVRIREGDIAVSRHNERSCFAQTCLWNKSVDGHVYVAYTLSPFYSEVDESGIKRGMKLIERGTCVRFVPKTHERDYLDIQPKSGCWSFVGMVGGGQPLSLQSPGCMWSGVAAHEFMHALGFVHEQSRSDRDRYVTILWDNIMEGQKHNFRKYHTNNLNTAYDYSSVMHYGRFAFSEEGLPTIMPKPDPNIPIGQRDGPSPLDIHKINLLYNCGGRI